ncbi:ENHANCED EM LEVEL [Hibiscus trionum]|uniref:ENHANCED EM LEVEL n=1 Tax=Hibiscus trionum TaxID=183268 RepID=A0A9W7HGQ2_HIBTR|nr:ENHANCED EM LEVEL [Hibiscus trionum]
MGDRFMISPNTAEGQQFPPQATSLYNLTFDEVQSQLGKIGKPLNAMNLDELLRSLIAVEGASSSSSVASFFLRNIHLNGRLSKKTVDEVWKEIVNHGRGNVNSMDNQIVQHQLTLGKTTLEDFLVRAGVINTGIQEGDLNPQQLMEIDPMAVVSQQADWLHFQMAAVQQQQQQQMTMMDSNFNVPESVYENQVVDVGYHENQLAIAMPIPAMSFSATSSESQPTAARKHRYSDVMEKTIERRQKRMIKNRESAARSRARKQAYTNQLELEVDQLRKMNSWLKRQKETEMLLSSNTNDTVPKYQLRRTSSASF